MTEHTLDEKVEPSGSPSRVVLEKEETEKEDVEQSAQPETAKEAQAPGTIAQENETAVVPPPEENALVRGNSEKAEVPLLENVAKEIVCPRTSMQNEEAVHSFQAPP